MATEPHTEAWVVKRAIALITRRGGHVQKNPQTGRGRKGTADLTACYRGRYLAIECKRPAGPRGGRPHPLSRLQTLHLRDVNNAGGIGFLLDDPDVLSRLLDTIDDNDNRMIYITHDYGVTFTRPDQPAIFIHVATGTPPLFNHGA